MLKRLLSLPGRLGAQGAPEPPADKPDRGLDDALSLRPVRRADRDVGAVVLGELRELRVQPVRARDTAVAIRSPRQTRCVPPSASRTSCSAPAK